MNELSTILGIIEHDLPAAGVEPLMIGGYAVNHYGYTRNTLDIDFMVATDQMDALRPILTGAGFINVSAMDNVVFFSAPDSAFRAAFIKVDPQAVRTLRAQAVLATLRGHSIPVPSLEDLLAVNKTYLGKRMPPRLSMDDYATWLMECLKDITPEQARRQKELEERIEKPFSLPPDYHPSDSRYSRPAPRSS